MARKRVVTSKPTRNGCSTCRIRRIKCDETRPNCHRCTSTGRKCDGYPYALQSTRNETRTRLLVPSKPWDGLGPLLKGPDTFPLLARLDASERHALQFFTLEVAGPMQLSLPAPGWIQVALQLSLSEQTVLYAITALTAMLKAQDRVLFDMSLQKFTCMDYRFSMQQYGKAMSMLRKHINDAVKLAAAIEPILISCLLFVSFEVLHDDMPTARAHLQMGRGIVVDYLKRATGQTRMLPSGAKVNTSQVIGQLAGSFERFQSHAIALLEPVPSSDTKPLALAPSAFTSLNEAKMLLDSIVHPGDQLRMEIVQLARCQLLATNRGFADLDQVTQLCATKCLSRSKALRISNQLSGQLDELLSGHSAWLEAFIEYKNSEAVKPSRQLLFLELQHFCSYLLLSTCRTVEDNEAALRPQTFIYILDLIDQYLVLAAQSPPGVIETKAQQTYSLEMAALPALSLIACKTDSLLVRQRAIEIFRTCGIVEGCCGSELTGRIMAAIVGVESGPLECPNTSYSETDRPRKELHVLERPKFLEIAATARWEHIRVVYGRFSSQAHAELELLQYEGIGYPLHIGLTAKRKLPLNLNAATPWLPDQTLRWTNSTNEI